MRKSRKIGIAVAIGVLIALIAATLYAVHDPDRYLPRVIAYAQQKSGLQIEIRHVAVHWTPLSIRLFDVGIRDPKPFPTGYFLKAPEVDANLAWGPLLHRQIVIRALTVKKPVVDLISDPDGLWNFQNPSIQKNQPARFSFGTISNLQVENGTLLASALIDPSDKPGPVVLRVEDFSGGVKRLDFKQWKGPSGPAPIAGSLHADKAQFGDIHLTNVKSGIEILPAQFTFHNFQAKTYRGQANGDFTFNFAKTRTRFDTDLKVSGVGINYLLKEFQSGPPAITGMMQAQFKLGGTIEHTANPLAGIRGTGHFTIRNGEIAALKASKSMTQMKRFRNPAAAKLPVSAFSTFSGDVDLTSEKLVNKQVGIDFYGIDVDGSGSLAEPSGRLNYKGTATILKKQGFFLRTFAEVFKGADSRHGRLVFPIRVSGTLANPVCKVAD